MAHIILDDFIDIGSGSDHDATSWQIATDSKFKNIIDESLHDTKNLTRWYTMVPKPGEEGYHADLKVLYARVKIHVREYESDWFVIGPMDQNDQQVVITEEGEEDIHTSSKKLDLQ